MSNEGKKILGAIKATKIALSKMQEKTTQTTPSNQKVHTFPITIIFSVIYFPAIVWWFLNYPFFLFEEFLKIITLGLSFFESNGLVLWLFPSAAYIAVISSLTAILIYGNIFILQPLLFMFKENLMGKTITLQFKILALLLIPLIITFAANENGNTLSEDSEIFIQKSNSTWNNMIESISCSFNPECVLKTKNQVTATNTQREEYSIALIKPDDTLWNIEDLKEYGLPIRYKILSVGGGIYVDKLECYKDSTTKSSNLLDTVEIQERIYHDTAKEVSYTCNMENLQSKKKVDDNVRIIPVLYLSVDTTYTQEIPIVNIDKFLESHPDMKKDHIQEIKNKISDEYYNYDFLQSTDAMDTKISTIPEFPVFYSENYETNQQYRIALTFKETSNTFGELNKSIVTEIIPPKSLSFNANFNTPQELNTHKEISVLRFTLDSQNIQMNELDKEEFLIVKATSTFKRKSSSITFTLIDDNYQESAPLTPINTEQTSTDSSTQTTQEQTTTIPEETTNEGSLLDGEGTNSGP